MLDMRSYRGPNAENMQQSYGPDAYFLGPTQVAWLKRELMASKATWKVICNDMPLALIRIYDPDRNSRRVRPSSACLTLCFIEPLRTLCGRGRHRQGRGIMSQYLCHCIWNILPPSVHGGMISEWAVARIDR
jgi:hypothetical protein